MDFENARWVKLYCQDTGTWLRLGWQGRTVALHLLRAVNATMPWSQELPYVAPDAD